jgi:hypothetical protein
VAFIFAGYCNNVPNIREIFSPEISRHASRSELKTTDCNYSIDVWLVRHIVVVKFMQSDIRCFALRFECFVVGDGSNAGACQEEEENQTF